MKTRSYEDGLDEDWELSEGALEKNLADKKDYARRARAVAILGVHMELSQPTLRERVLIEAAHLDDDCHVCVFARDEAVKLMAHENAVRLDGFSTSRFSSFAEILPTTYERERSSPPLNSLYSREARFVNGLSGLPTTATIAGEVKDPISPREPAELDQGDVIRNAFLQSPQEVTMKQSAVVMLFVTFASLISFTLAGQDAEKPRRGFFSGLKEGQPVVLKDIAGRYEITTLEDLPGMLGHKISEVGPDYIAVEDMVGVTQTKIPVYSIKSLVKLKSPRK